MPCSVMIGRRTILAALASAAGDTALAAAVAFPETPTLLVGGPAGSDADRWAERIAGPLGKTLLGAPSINRESIGGPDGVTAANHFQARMVPDGATAMLMPGATALSWLVGDARVRFDAGRWAPLWGGEVSALVVSRVPLVRGRAVQVAVTDVVGPDLAMLLALELMDVPAVPVTAEPAQAANLDAAQGDVVLLRGSRLRQHAAALIGRPWAAAFGLGLVRGDGALERDPSFPDVPTASELLASGPLTRPELASALSAAIAAATLDMALVLPQLSPAAVLAWWRQGCTVLAGVPAIQAEAARTLVRPIAAGRLAASLANITADGAVLLDLRRWLAERHHWRPV